MISYVPILTDIYTVFTENEIKTKIESRAHV